eukprot:3311220-Pyramimonas_sp.AAC.1
MSVVVQATKKGGIPVAVEKRPKGKVVTVVRNVSGDAKGLLSSLQNAAGAGGSDHGSFIELQGDHQRMVEEYLVQHGYVKGVKGSKPKPPPPPPPTAAEADAAPEASSDGDRRTGKKKRWPKPQEDTENVALVLSSSTAPANWMKAEKDSPAKHRFGVLMRSYPYWAHDYARLVMMATLSPDATSRTCLVHMIFEARERPNA